MAYFAAADNLSWKNQYETVCFNPVFAQVHFAAGIAFLAEGGYDAVIPIWVEVVGQQRGVVQNDELVARIYNIEEGFSMPARRWSAFLIMVSPF